MDSTKLKEDLSNCLINFDSRVLITELLDNYKSTYDEVNKIIENYLQEQEKKDKIKFVKRFIVYGAMDGEMEKQVFKIVEEPKLKEWLIKLKNAESSLYSIEIAGGAKAAAEIFKPMSIKDCEKSKRKPATKTLTSNGELEKSTSSINKNDIKQEKAASNVKKESPKTETAIKKSPSKNETPHPDTKDKKSVGKKGINNFFAPSTTAASKKSEDSKPAKGSAIKPTTPKKMQDFFKKQAENSKTSTKIAEKSAVNTSVQLFQEDEPEEEEEEVSSDEEEKLEALKRDIISSDVEIENESDSKPSTSVKRRRILDSDDDEEDPPVKQEKLDTEEETKEPVAETYLDDEGFVITKKPKQKAATRKSTNSPKAPPVTIKTSPKEATKKSNLKKDTKPATNPTTKTKQAGILNFFSKK